MMHALGCAESLHSPHTTNEPHYICVKRNAKLLLHSFHPTHDARRTTTPPETTRSQATHYVTITSRRHSNDETDHAAVEIERVRMDKLVTQLRSNLCNVTVLSDTDLEVLANMDPDSVSDLGGKEFVTQLKEIAGRLGGVCILTDRANNLSLCSPRQFCTPILLSRRGTAAA